MSNEQYLQMFIEETSEYLDNINKQFLTLENDPHNMDAINEIFRMIHTIKGMAGTMQFIKMQKLSHNMENILDMLRNGKISITSDMMDILFKCVDFLQRQLGEIALSGSEGSEDITSLIDNLSNYLNGNVKLTDLTVSKDDTKSPVIDPYVANLVKIGVEKGFNAYKIHIILRSDCVLKSARAYIIFKNLEEYAEIIQSIPSVQEIENEQFGNDFTVVILTRESQEYVFNNVNSMLEIEKVEIESYSAVESKESHGLQQNLPAVSKQEQRPTKSIRIDVERLDDFVNLAGELIITRNRIEDINVRHNDPELNEALEYMGRLTSALHDLVMKIRMVPVDVVFNRFPRVVRDLSRATNKKVSLIMSGNETEMDRSLLDEIGDPLIHLIRNAVDHGIELAEQRVEIGKPETGTVELKAYHDGNDVVIEIADDGAGIDIEKVVTKAVEKGLASAEEVKNMNNDEIVSFLFQPGFSTSDVVTDISGRGVGLDVVKTKIESLGGVVEVKSLRGQGTRFIIRMPLTLSIIQALLVTVGTEIYAIPLNSIIEIINIDSTTVKVLRNQQDVVNYRSVFIPIIYLNRVLNVPPNSEKPSQAITAIVIKKGEKMAALTVDQLIDQKDIVVKPLGKYLSGIKSLSGATILGDGRVALILDVNHLV